jgi:hypothetical protein
VFFLFIRYLYENKKLMAQKFITKKNRHLFRRPVKARIEEKVVIELPVTEEVIETPVITAEIYTPDTTIVPMVDTEVVKKKKPVKKNKEVEEVEIIESENNE